MQASLLDLYDPDRAQEILHAGEPVDWETFLSAMNASMQEQALNRGARFRIISTDSDFSDAGFAIAGAP